MAQFTAVFSTSGGGAFIAVTSNHDSYRVLASISPSVADNPLKALAAIGYQLAYPDHRSLFADTMGRTGYQNVYVVPIA